MELFSEKVSRWPLWAFDAVEQTKWRWSKKCKITQTPSGLKNVRSRQ